MQLPNYSRSFLYKTNGNNQAAENESFMQSAQISQLNKEQSNQKIDEDGGEGQIDGADERIDVQSHTAGIGPAVDGDVIAKSRDRRDGRDDEEGINEPGEAENDMLFDESGRDREPQQREDGDRAYHQRRQPSSSGSFRHSHDEMLSDSD